MSKLISFDIIFANNPPVFFGGQSVSGTVIVQLRDAMQMRGIRARIHGRAYSRVEVSKTRSVSDGHGGRKSESYTETYVEYETYLDYQVTLWGKQVGDQSIGNPVLPAGRYDFNFNFILPTNVRMPSSYEHGPRCNIRYMITANIDRPWKFDHVSKRAFTVLESIDVNHPSLLLKPFALQNEKFLCCLCCKSGPLKLTGSIDRCGYCPGEGILINAECENLTNRKMDYVRARLYRSVTWRARGHSNNRIITDFEIRSPGQIEEGASFNWNNQFVALPSIPPSITTSRLISVTYEFQISVVIPYGINLHISFPIVIGTIPLRINYGSTAMGMQPPVQIEQLSVQIEQPSAQIEQPSAQIEQPSAQIEQPSAQIQQASVQIEQPPSPGAMTGIPAYLPDNVPDATPGGVPGSSDALPPPPIGFVDPSPDTGLQNAPPSSYQVCADGAVDIKDNDDSDYLMGERNFAPMYSFASNYQPPSSEIIPSGNPTI